MTRKLNTGTRNKQTWRRVLLGAQKDEDKTEMTLGQTGHEKGTKIIKQEPRTRNISRSRRGIS